MPGFTFAFGQSPDIIKDAFQAYVKPLGWKFEELLDGNGWKVIGTGYAKYPLETILFSGVSVVFEGYVYNKLKSDFVKRIVAKIVANEWEELSQIIADADGEFCMLVHMIERNKVFILNDSWGRLPIYFHQSQRSILISRDLGLLRSMGKCATPIKESIAEFLLFGFSLGDHTLWKDVNKVKASSQIAIDLQTGSMTFYTSFKLPIRIDSKEVNTEALLTSLKVGITNRMACLPKMTLSLSGGLDSRLIAGILNDLNYQIPAYTIKQTGGHHQDDMLSAQQITQRLNWKDWRIFQFEEGSEIDLAMLNWVKPGLNSLDLAFLMPYFKQIASESDAVITGDGGDKFLVDTRPLYSLLSLDDVLDYIIERQGRTTIKQVAEICGLDFNLFRNHLIDHLKSYGMINPIDVYRNFQLRERAMNWLFEGEDRNRTHIWSTTPYYMPNFIQLSLSFSDKEKQYGKLFKCLFQFLPGHLEEISNPNWKNNLNRMHAIRWVHFKQAMKAKLHLAPKKSIHPADLDFAKTLLNGAI